MIELIGWIGNTFLIVGLWRVGSKYRDAFLYTAIGEFVWLIYSIYLGLPSMVFLCVIFLFLALRNYYMWGKVKGDL